MKFPWPQLLDWYAREGRRGLPWREYGSWTRGRIGYPVWVAEVMLQQTQVERGSKFFTRFLGKFPTVESLASAAWEEVFPYWDGLGYYSRGRRMIETAKAVMERFSGVFPDGPERLITLPGVGPYTARSVAAFAYGKPFLSWDVNLQKVFARYFFGRKDAQVPDALKAELEAEMAALGLSGRDVNNALMDFGSLVSLGDASKVGFLGYPLPGCRFAATAGGLEAGLKKTRGAKAAGKAFAAKDARIAVVLHENGKAFFSPKKSRWEPFWLPASPGDHRAAVKEWFAEKHGLALSVRPAFAKTSDEKGPAIWYRAQVQAGEAKFARFGKADAALPKGG